MTDNYSEDEIEVINTTLRETRTSKYNANFGNTDFSKLKTESKKALEQNNFECVSCGKKGGVEGDEVLVLDLYNGFEQYNSKDDAIKSDNLVPLCKECIQEQDTSTPVSQAPSTKKTTVAEQTKQSLSNFENFVANNTPSLILKRNLGGIFGLLVVVSLITLLYGQFMTNQGAIGFYTNIINTITGYINYITTEQPLLSFVIITPFILIYNIIEHYQPPEYFTPTYVNSFNKFVSLPYILHPIALFLVTIVWVTLSLSITTDYINLALANQEGLFAISFIVYLVLLFTLPYMFGKIVDSDRSLIMSRSLASKSEIKALEYDDIITTEGGGLKGKVNDKYINEVFREGQELIGEYYYPVVWRSIMSLLMAFIFILVFGGIFNNISIITETLIFASPSLLLILYIGFRQMKYRQVAKEFKESTEKVKSEAGVK